MNIFSQMAKSVIENSNGKIRTFPNGYEYSDAGATNSSGVHIPSSFDATGRPVSLSLGVLSTGSCPAPPAGGDYPNHKGMAGYWVPMKICRKCPHHIKRRRGQPYPCCAVLRKIRTERGTPAEQISIAMME